MFCQQLLNTSIAACIIPFTNFQPFQAWVSKKLPIIFVIKKMKELERGTCGDDRRSSCAKTDIKSRTPPILATDSACWYSSTSATASLYTACSSQTKTSPSIKKGKTPYRYNHLEHQKEHLLDPPPDQRLHTKPHLPQRNRKKQ